jgi:hypothetical protein
MLYRVAADLLVHVLPIDVGKSPETLRSHTLQVGERLGRAAADRPPAITMSLDSTFIRSREEGERHLEVRVGNVETVGAGRQVFGAVAKIDTDITVLTRQNRQIVGRTADPEVRIHGRFFRPAVDPCRCRGHEAADSRLVLRRHATPAQNTSRQRIIDRQS